MLAQLCCLSLLATDTPAVDRPMTERWLDEIPARPAAGVVQGSLSYEQANAYYRLLDHAAAVDQTELCDAATALIAERLGDDPKLFPSLLAEPERWQGKPVRLTGHVNRVLAIPPPPDSGRERFYEAWLVSPDSQRYPTVLICDSIPQGMPVGENTLSGITACGYFFKLHAYPARDGKGRLAPMVMVGSLQWSPPQPIEPAFGTSGVVAIALVAGVVLIGGAVVVSRRRPARSRRNSEFTLTTDPPSGRDQEARLEFLDEARPQADSDEWPHSD